MSTVRRAIVDCLTRCQKALAPNEIAAKTGLVSSSVRRELQGMFKKGIVAKGDKHTYSLATSAVEVQEQGNRVAYTAKPLGTKRRVRVDRGRVKKMLYVLSARQIQQLIDRGQIACPDCGGKEIVWSCCNKPVSDPALLEKLEKEVKKK